MRKSFKKALSLGLAATMVVGLGSGAVTTEAASLSADKIASYTVRPYRGYIGFQTSLYNFRNQFDDEDYGIVNTAARKKNLETEAKQNSIYASADAVEPGISSDSFDWTKTFLYAIADGTETNEQEFRDLDGDGTKDKYTVPKKTKKIPGTADFISPDISYDGTYTVSMKNFPAETFLYDHGFRMLFVSTTIPLSEANVKFSNISLKIDGAEVYTAAEGVIRNKTDSPNTYTLVLANEYDYTDYGLKTEKKGTKGDAVPDMVWENAKATGKTPGQINMPKTSIDVTFTLSGLGQAPAGYVPSDQSSSAASGSGITSAPAITSLDKGATFTSGNFKYKVTKAGEKSGTSTVALTGLKASAKKKTSLTIPATVTNKNFKYKVTAINSKAFANSKKLKTVTIGANVKTIQKNAFSNCKNLSALKMKGKVTKVAKGAFKGCKKKIKVSGKSKAANVKALKKSGYKKFK